MKLNTTSRLSNLWHQLMLLLLVMGPLLALTSCGDDEPSTVIKYYIKIEEEMRVDGSTDNITAFPNPAELMKEALANAYPQANANGADSDVIAACDKVYNEYVSTYTGYDHNITSVMSLVKATVSDDIVRTNELLKTYSFNINPIEIDE